jgi:hypothetical protein
METPEPEVHCDLHRKYMITNIKYNETYKDIAGWM